MSFMGMQANAAVTTTPGKYMDGGNSSSGGADPHAAVKRARYIAGGLFIALMILHSRKVD